MKAKAVDNKSKTAVNKDNKTSSVKNDIKEIKVVTWNVAGLLGRLVECEVSNFLCKFDIICLQETFLVYDFNTELKFKNYNCTQSHAAKLSTAGRPSGGVLLLWKKSLDGFIDVINTGIKNVLCIKIDKSLLNLTNDVILVTMYIHPINSAYYKEMEQENTLDLIEDFLAGMLESHPDVSVLMAGDANCRISDWAPVIEEKDVNYLEKEQVIIFERKSIDNVINNYGKKMIEFCMCFQLIPLNGLKEKHFPKGYTYISERGNSTVDFFISSIDLLENICDLRIESRVESDHLPVTTKLITIQSKNITEQK